MGITTYGINTLTTATPGTVSFTPPSGTGTVVNIDVGGGGGAGTLSCLRINSYYKSPINNGTPGTIGASSGWTNLWDVVTPSIVDANDFSFDPVTNDLVYDGADPICVEITARANIAMASGMTRTCAIEIWENGATVNANVESAIAIESNFYSSGALLLNINTQINPGDRFQLRLRDIEAPGPNSNIRVHSAQLSISGYLYTV